MHLILFFVGAIFAFIIALWIVSIVWAIIASVFEAVSDGIDQASAWVGRWFTVKGFPAKGLVFAMCFVFFAALGLWAGGE